MKTIALKSLQKEAEKHFTWKTINRENLYERINYKSYLWLNYNLKILKEIWDLNLKMVLDTDYVYWDKLFIDYLNWMVATYLEYYIRENHKLWNAVRDDEDFN
jgi:sugar phosphate isomerase/epimerase